MTAVACPACSGEWSSPELRIGDCGLTVAYLLEDQFFKGWTVLVLKRHATELWQLDATERAGLIEEVSRVARAVGAAFGAAKMNYALLGNAVPHIHWHLIPRRADDPAAGGAVWAIAHEPRRPSAGEAVESITLIRRHLGA